MKFILIYKIPVTYLIYLDENGDTCVDWEFLEVVYARREESPQLIPEENRKDFKFDPVLYSDSVVMPWYRNQDQPQVKFLYIHFFIIMYLDFIFHYQFLPYSIFM